VGKIFFASEKSQERATLLCDVIADGPTQHRIAGFERVEDSSLRDWTFHVKFHFDANLSQRS
jgi:hypothetical protein